MNGYKNDIGWWRRFPNGLDHRFSQRSDGTIAISLCGLVCRADTLCRGLVHNTCPECLVIADNRDWMFELGEVS